MAESDDSESKDRDPADTPSQFDLAADLHGRDSAILRDLAAESRGLALAVRAAGLSLRPLACRAEEPRRLLLTLAA